MLGAHSRTSFSTCLRVGFDNLLCALPAVGIMGRWGIGIPDAILAPPSPVRHPWNHSWEPPVGGTRGAGRRFHPVLRCERPRLDCLPIYKGNL
jgi:hypothetical protein